MNILLFPIKLINWLFNFILLSIINLFYPIFDLLFNKYSQYSIENINEEDMNHINKTIDEISSELDINNLYKNDFNELIKSLSKYEKEYVKDIKTNQLCYLKIRYLFKILKLAKEAISKLEEVSTDDRKISYYENKKYSSLDNLIEEYNIYLAKKGHEKVSFKSAKKEIKFKRLLARLKRNKTLFFNYYLTILTIYPLNKKILKIKKDEEDIFELFENMFDFYRVGHATPKQIQKSVAILLCSLYKENMTERELKDVIGKIIDYTFDTDSPYKNFNNIEQEPYIKNIVFNFPIFDCNTDLANKQNITIKRFLLANNQYIHKLIPKFIKRFVLNKYIIKPLPFYLKNDLLTFFGIMQKKK